MLTASCQHSPSHVHNNICSSLHTYCLQSHVAHHKSSDTWFQTSSCAYRRRKRYGQLPPSTMSAASSTPHQQLSSQLRCQADLKRNGPQKALSLELYLTPSTHQVLTPAIRLLCQLCHSSSSSSSCQHLHQEHGLQQVMTVHEPCLVYAASPAAPVIKQNRDREDGEGGRVGVNCYSSAHPDVLNCFQDESSYVGIGAISDSSTSSSSSEAGWRQLAALCCTLTTSQTS